MEEPLFRLAHRQIQQILSNALHSLIELSSSNILQSNSIRSRSASHHPRCSLPNTTNDLTHYRTSHSASQLLPTLDSDVSYRTFDVQYSFGLHNSSFEQSPSICDAVGNWTDRLITNSIQMALVEIEHGNRTNANHIRVLCLYVDELIRTIVEQSIAQISRRDIERFSACITEDIITDALLIVAEDQVDICNSHQSFSTCQYRTLKEPLMDSFVNSIAQRIHTKSLDALRETFELVTDTV